MISQFESLSETVGVALVIPAQPYTIIVFVIGCRTTKSFGAIRVFEKGVCFHHCSHRDYSYILHDLHSMTRTYKATMTL